VKISLIASGSVNTTIVPCPNAFTVTGAGHCSIERRIALYGLKA
jgi:hypothetical protein